MLLQHNFVMGEMLADWELGEHLLLIGNQGVGKNKVADRFLQLLNRPRQYIQLHRFAIAYCSLLTRHDRFEQSN